MQNIPVVNVVGGSLFVDNIGRDRPFNNLNLCYGYVGFFSYKETVNI